MKENNRDETFMLLALEVSKKALENCSPNPPVGCIVVANGFVIAEGYTQAPGQAHAEIDALTKISETQSNLVVYVTLEPCSFFGRTPSCARTIAADPRIDKVVVSIIDPDPRNNGKGIDILQANNKEVVLGVCAKEVESFLIPYLHSKTGQVSD